MSNVESRTILDAKAVERALVRISFEIIERNKGTENLCIIGIMGGGVEMANIIAGRISAIEGKEVPVGYLDTTPFRDDLNYRGGVMDHSEIDFSLADKRVVLVDDVLYTGRTVRAAIDGIIEKGRPTSIQLAVLVDRGHRELPIRADFVGKNLPTSTEERVIVTIAKEGSDVVLIRDH